MITIRFARF